MKKHEIFMKGYLDKCIQITFLDNLYVTGTYIDYHYPNNVIVIMPEDKGEDARLFIPLSAIKTIARWFY